MANKGIGENVSRKTGSRKAHTSSRYYAQRLHTGKAPRSWVRPFRRPMSIRFG